MEGLPGWGISSMPWPLPRQHKYERRYTPSTHTFTLTRRIWKNDYDGQIIFEDLVGLQLPDSCLTGEQKPRKNTPRKLVPTSNWARVRCVTVQHATACSTVVDVLWNTILNNFSFKIQVTFNWDQLLRNLHFIYMDPSIISDIWIIKKYKIFGSHIGLVIKSNLLKHEEPASTHEGDDGCHPQRLVVLFFEQTALLLYFLYGIDEHLPSLCKNAYAHLITVCM